MRPRRKTMSVAAMVLGIVGLILCWIPVVGLLGVVLGLVALILGILSMRSPTGNKGLGIVGLVIGAIALVGGSIIQVVTYVAVDKGIDAVQSAMDKAPVQNLPAEAPFQQKP